MQKIVIVFGLPGSGKTTYFQEFFAKTDDRLVCDDYHDQAPDRDFASSVLYDEFCAALTEGKDIIMTDIAWCKPDRFSAMLIGLERTIEEIGVGVTIEYVYFENNPVLCKKNIVHRNRVAWRVEKELDYVAQFSSGYVIPENAVVLPVVDATTCG